MTYTVIVHVGMTDIAENLVPESRSGNFASTTAAETISPVGVIYQATIQATNGPRFFRLSHP